LSFHIFHFSLKAFGRGKGAGFAFSMENEKYEMRNGQSALLQPWQEQQGLNSRECPSPDPFREVNLLVPPLAREGNTPACRLKTAQRFFICHFAFFIFHLRRKPRLSPSRTGWRALALRFQWKMKNMK
jgi:hypothetical protein